MSGPVRKQYVFTLFFKRLFRTEEVNWMLLGGNALLIRAGGEGVRKFVCEALI